MAGVVGGVVEFKDIKKVKMCKKCANKYAAVHAVVLVPC